MMQQGAGGQAPSAGSAPPQGVAPPQWGAIPPPIPTQYQQPHPQAMWGQQPSQIPPPSLPQQYGVAVPPQAAASPSVGPEEVRTLWIGDLQYWMDDNYIYSCFAQTGEVRKAILLLLGYLLFFRVSFSFFQGFLYRVMDFLENRPPIL